MNELQVFSFESQQVRTTTDENGNPWWVAKDVCGCLGIKNHRDAVSKLDEDERASDLLDGSITISESGLYTLIIRSNKEEAKKFKKWITSEVLPSIRKTGGYGPQFTVSRSALEVVPLAAEKIFPALLNFAGMIGLTGNQKVLSAVQGTKAVSGVNLLEIVGQSHLIAEKQVRHMTPTELGKTMGLSAQAFNKLLQEKGLQFKDGDHWKPTAVGESYAILLDTTKKHTSGAPIQQLRWLETVLEVVSLSGVA